MAAVGRFRRRVSGELPRPTFALHRMAGMYLTPSTESRYVMRFHAVCVRSHTFSDQQVEGYKTALDAELTATSSEARKPIIARRARESRRSGRVDDYCRSSHSTHSAVHSENHSTRAWARVRVGTLLQPTLRSRMSRGRRSAGHPVLAQSVPPGE